MTEQNFLLIFSIFVRNLGCCIYQCTAFNIKITMIAAPSDWLAGAYHNVNHTLFLPVA